jgi:hypothetical protein
MSWLHISTRIRLILVSIVVLAAESAAQTAGVTGIITDPSGALVAQVSVSVVAGDGDAHKTVTDERGVYTASGLTPGLYTIKCVANGFAVFQQSDIRLHAGRIRRLDISLGIEVLQEEINVSDGGTDLGTSPDNNADALIFRGNDLNALPDDPAQLQAQLQAMAGPVSGSDESQLYVDGFDAQKLPPKSAIRELRINQNPYSAQFDRPGRGRIEVITKPGADAFHGGLWSGGNDSTLNSRNPFAQQQPPYHSVQLDWNLSGPITKKASFFLNADWTKTQTNAIVDAETLDPSLNQIHLSQALSNPTASVGFSPRFDVQLGPANTLMLRYQFGHGTTTDGGVGQFALPSQGYDTNDLWQSIQISDTRTYGKKSVNQFRFQYSLNQNAQEPQSSTPAITVQGAFTGGGSNAGSMRDDQDHYELQDNVSVGLGKHLAGFGGRLRVVRDRNFSTANFNGNFVFSSLDAYQITEEGIRQGLTLAQIQAQGGGASQFSTNSGVPEISVAEADAGIYAEDNWNLRPNLTLGCGLRFETQTGISNHLNFAPRFSVAWGIGNGGKGWSKTVFRAGYGWFYTRFAANYVLQAERQDGVNQTEFIVASPDFFPNIPPLSTLAEQSAPTVYRTNSATRAPYVMQTSVSIDRQIAKSTTLSLAYVNSRGLHQLFSQNINTPLPGTYNPADPASGLRPLGTNQNIYEYESEGIFKQNQFVANVSLRSGSRLSLFGSYILNYANGNTSGAGSFPSNEYDINVDYGRTLYDVRHRASLGGSFSLPYGFRVTPFIAIASGAPFNIVVGQDLNGDSVFNDRPTFASDLTRPSVVSTPWGVFDTEPIAGQHVIPVNYGTGSGQFTANMTLGKTVGFGRNHERQILARDGGPKTSTERYSLTFHVSAQNVINKVNLGSPVGILGSPLFGRSTSLNGSSTGNRIIALEMQFTF